MTHNQNKILSISLLAALLSFSSVSFSQESSSAKLPESAGSSGTTQTSAMQIQPEDAEKKSFNMEAGVEYSKKVEADQVGERESSTDYSLVLGYKLSDLATLSAKGVLSQDNTGPRDTSFSNTTITLGIKGKVLNDELKTVHSLVGIIPTNNDSIERDRLKGAVGISNGLAFENPYVKVKYLLGLTKNMHEFNFNREGKANVEYSLTNTLDVVVPIGEKYAVNVTGIFKNGRTYGGFSRSSFIFNAVAGYDLSKNLNIYAGTANEAGALKANGTDSNLSAYDEKTSVWLGGLTYAY